MGQRKRQYVEVLKDSLKYSKLLIAVANTQTFILNYTFFNVPEKEYTRPVTGKFEANRNAAVSLAKRSDSQLTGSLLVSSYAIRRTKQTSESV